MNKNVVAVFAAVCGLFMVSCDTPKDLTPGAKVSVDTVEPGTRNTHNVGHVNKVHGETHKPEVMPNHDQGANTIQAGDSLSDSTKTNTEAGAIRR